MSDTKENSDFDRKHARELFVIYIKSLNDVDEKKAVKALQEFRDYDKDKLFLNNRDMDLIFTMYANRITTINGMEKFIRLSSDIVTLYANSVTDDKYKSVNLSAIQVLMTDQKTILIASMLVQHIMDDVDPNYFWHTSYSQIQHLNVVVNVDFTAFTKYFLATIPRGGENKIEKQYDYIKMYLFYCFEYWQLDKMEWLIDFSCRRRISIQNDNPHSYIGLINEKGYGDKFKSVKYKEQLNRIFYDINDITYSKIWITVIPKRKK